MITEPIKDVCAEEETTVGAYFVSNYPPYSFWTPDRVNEAYRALARAPAAGTPMGIYIHIPFCRKRCHFCYFKVYTDKDSAEVRNYLDALIAELKGYAGKKFIGRRHTHVVYFGGGTPSYLSENQLRHLTDSMKAMLPWDEIEE